MSSVEKIKELVSQLEPKDACEVWMLASAFIGKLSRGESVSTEWMQKTLKGVSPNVSELATKAWGIILGFNAND